ncbi:MAG: CTP synthetase [Candidatus Diapherotrites archaeon CG10_big_fil_rev_8_21_14_0_10_31_34]|nr:MAG: CTP synthetase [Candidatus Diapherotrites archaeon CG10_big_fil_rev_8_21_14_0_10_31_34]
MGEKQLSELGKKSVDSEFFSPVPEGYQKGKYKYVFITGSVISGIGKGTVTSSIAKLLEERGLKVSPMKAEAYYNVDAGTLNPFRHGEVFVLDDGTETDMDLGSYERFIDGNLTKENYLTTGKILTEILEKERAGKYLGRDVQFIPHVTGETKKYFRKLAVDSKAEVILIEIGGTVGDYENMYLLEAARQLRYEEGEDNVCFINLTYIFEPKTLGEQKSKAAQLGIKKMIEMGLMPDIVICRSENPVHDTIREKISVFSNVPLNRVIGLHDSKEFYRIPLMLKEQGLDKAVFETLKIDEKKLVNNKSLEKWTEKMTVVNPKKKILIGIAGKYTGLKDSYISIIKALEHCEAEFNVKIEVKWIEATEIETAKKKVSEVMKGVNGLIVPGGYGKRGAEGKVECIKYCREKNIPFLGICYGLQMALVEFARNVLGKKNASTSEIDSKTEFPVVCLLPDQRKIEGLGGNNRLGGFDIEVKKNSIAFELYGKEKVRERFRHRYECNPDYIKEFESKGLVFSGKAPKVNIMQIIELPKHKFFFGTQYHPEFTSRPLNPSPCFKGLIKACL